MKRIVLTLAMLCVASAAQAEEWSYWKMNALAKFRWGVHYGLWYQTKHDCVVEKTGNKKGEYGENNLPDNMEWAGQSDITDYVRDHCAPNKKPPEPTHAEATKTPVDKPKALTAQASVPQKPPVKAATTIKWPDSPLSTFEYRWSELEERWHWDFSN